MANTLQMNVLVVYGMGLHKYDWQPALPIAASVLMTQRVHAPLLCHVPLQNTQVNIVASIPYTFPTHTHLPPLDQDLDRDLDLDRDAPRSPGLLLSRRPRPPPPRPRP
jgi:hypothetical protein